MAPLLSEDNEPENTEHHTVIRWILILLSIFQSRFFVTNQAMAWLTKFIKVLLTFLGKYSPKIAHIAAAFPVELNNFRKKIEEDRKFQCRGACTNCDSIYKFEDCITKVGLIVSGKKCLFKPV